MLSANGTENPPSGNWAWLTAAITGIVSILTAVIHRVTRKPQRIPSQNAQEIFERLGYLETRQQTTEDSINRAWVAIEDIRRDVSYIKREMVSRDDLEHSLREFERRISKLLENRA